MLNSTATVAGEVIVLSDSPTWIALISQLLLFLQFLYTTVCSTRHQLYSEQERQVWYHCSLSTLAVIEVLCYIAT